MKRIPIDKTRSITRASRVAAICDRKADLADIRRQLAHRSGDGPKSDGFDDPRLYSGSIVLASPTGSMFVYAASIANTTLEFKRRIEQRIGIDAAHFAVIRRGVDVDDPVFDLLVSATTFEMLESVAATPGASAAEGFSVWLEQRVGI